MPSVALGVRHDPDSVPAVRSANGGSGYTVPLRIVPDRSERPEHLVQSARAKGCDVFADDPARSRFGDDAVHFEPEAGSIAGEPGAFAGEADVLAGEPAGNDVGLDSVLSQSLTGQLLDVRIQPCFGEMLRQHALGVRLDLAYSRNREAGIAEPQFEAADAAEQP